jgi:hypothetical protein
VSPKHWYVQHSVTSQNTTALIKLKFNVALCRLNNATDVNSLFLLTLKFAVQTNPPVVLSLSQTHKFHTLSQRLFKIVFNIILTLSGVPKGVWVVQTLPHPPKLRSFDKAEPNSQFRGKYIRNNLIRIRGSLICKLSGTPD